MTKKSSFYMQDCKLLLKLIKYNELKVDGFLISYDAFKFSNWVQIILKEITFLDDVFVISHDW